MMSNESAIEFVNHYHCKPYNSIEPEQCHLAILKQANLKQSSEVESKDFVEAQDCLFQDDLAQTNCPICLEDIFNEQGNSNQDEKSTDRQIEKQWDSVDQDFNITILCCHTFNWKCLIGWGGEGPNVGANEDHVYTCPLCRYHQNPQQLSHCDDCGVTDNYFEQLIQQNQDNDSNQIQEANADLKQFTLWTCLVCGHIGCFNLMTKIQFGKATEMVLENVQKGHAYDHYSESKHVYAMEIESKKVWDFSKENYVNRLIQNEIDGKLIEIGEYQGEAEANEDSTQIQQQSFSTQTPSKQVHLDSVFQFNKKIESLNHEYNTILVQTLENQRQYYESQIAGIWNEYDLKITNGQQQIQNLESQIQDEDQLVQQTNKEVEELKEQYSDHKMKFQESLMEVMTYTKQNAQMKKQNDEISQEQEKQIKELQDELIMLENEMADQKLCGQDLVNNLKMQKKIQNNQILQEQIEGGQTFMINDSNAGQKQNKKKKGKK